MSDITNPMGKMLLQLFFSSMLAKLQGGNVEAVIKDLEEGLKALEATDLQDFNE